MIPRLLGDVQTTQATVDAVEPKWDYFAAAEQSNWPHGQPINHDDWSMFAGRSRYAAHLSLIPADGKPLVYLPMGLRRSSPRRVRPQAVCAAQSLAGKRRAAASSMPTAAARPSASLSLGTTRSGEGKIVLRARGANLQSAMVPFSLPVRAPRRGSFFVDPTIPAGVFPDSTSTSGRRGRLEVAFAGERQMCRGIASRLCTLMESASRGPELCRCAWGCDARTPRRPGSIAPRR